MKRMPDINDGSATMCVRACFVHAEANQGLDYGLGSYYAYVAKVKLLLALWLGSHKIVYENQGLTLGQSRIIYSSVHNFQFYFQSLRTMCEVGHFDQNLQTGFVV
jgi:hypothetical protein